MGLLSRRAFRSAAMAVASTLWLPTFSQAADSACDPSQRRVVLGSQSNLPDLNSALLTSPAGLRGQSGTVEIPPGQWQQKTPAILHSCQRVTGSGPDSVLMFSGGGYFISNVAKNAGPGPAQSRSGAVAADNIELDHFTISAPQGPVPANAPSHRAIVLAGWPKEDSLSPTGGGVQGPEREHTRSLNPYPVRRGLGLHR